MQSEGTIVLAWHLPAIRNKSAWLSLFYVLVGMSNCFRNNQVRMISLWHRKISQVTSSSNSSHSGSYGNTPGCCLCLLGAACQLLKMFPSLKHFTLLVFPMTPWHYISIPSFVHLLSGSSYISSFKTYITSNRTIMLNSKPNISGIFLLQDKPYSNESDG